ncbi:tripartite motif-containing protein 55-like [Branchiostoma floridae]|nr:tripartite motif-containing protein 55-like [Branchiostoma floridae]
MASNLQRSTADFDKQFLTCPVCMLHFRDPRVLPCLHTFCRECLQEWTTKQQPLECPTCRTQVSLPDQGVDGLRTNFYVNNMLDFAAVKKGAGPGVPCQVCEGKGEGVRSWCVQCAVLLCESCTNTHRRFPAMKGHQIVTQENLEASEGVPSSFQRKAFCPKHEDQVLTFYCEPCQNLVCVACTIVDHRPGDKHDPVEIGSVAERKKRDLQNLLAKVKPREKLVRATLNEVKMKFSEFTTSADSAIEQATAYFDHLMSLLRDRKEEVVKEIGSRYQDVGKCLETQKEAMEFELAGLTSASEFCKQALEHGSDVNVIDIEGQAQQRVEELLTTPSDLTARPSQVVFSEGMTVVEFRDDVARAGCVHVRYTGKVDASRSQEEPLVSKTETKLEKLGQRKTVGEGSAAANPKPAALPSLGHLFKKPLGGWECDTYMAQNTAAASRFTFAAGSSASGAATTTSKATPSATGGVTFGTGATSGAAALGVASSGGAGGFTFGTGSSAAGAAASAGFKFGAKTASRRPDTAPKMTSIADLAKADQMSVPKPATNQSAAKNGQESDASIQAKVDLSSAFGTGTLYGSADASTAPSFGSTTVANLPVFGAGASAAPSSGLTLGAPLATPPSTGSAAATTSDFTIGAPATPPSTGSAAATTSGFAFGSSSTAASTTPAPLSFGAGAPSATTADDILTALFASLL